MVLTYNMLKKNGKVYINSKSYIWHHKPKKFKLDRISIYGLVEGNYIQPILHNRPFSKRKKLRIVF